jgi:hypothetical protein
MRARLPYVVAVLALVFSACASPRSALTNLWVDTRHEAVPTGHVMVVALWQDADARALWEERFTEMLEQRQAGATPSYLELESPMPDSAAVFREARSRKCDSVIVIHEHVMDRNTYYVPGFTVPQKQKIPRWYRSSGGVEVWAGGNAVEYSTLSCDVELWTPDGRGGMVWSGTTKLLHPGSDDYAATRVADAVLGELSRLGLVSGQF